MWNMLPLIIIIIMWKSFVSWYIILHDTWGGSSNTGNLLQFISFKLSTSLQGWTRKWKENENDHKNTHVPLCKPENTQTFIMSGRKSVHFGSSHVFKDRWCNGFLPAASEYSAVDGMTLSVHSVVKLHIKFAKGVQQYTLAVGGEGGGVGNYDQGNTGL